MPVELKVPEVGESITEVEIGKWLKSEGDPVQKDEPIVEIETDKITVELPAPAAGTVGKQLKSQGDTAEIGEVIGYLEEGQGKAAAAEKKAAEPARSKPKEEPTPAAERQATAQAEARGGPETSPGDTGRGAPPARSRDSEQITDRRAPQREPAATAEAEPRVMPAARRLLEEHRLSPEDIEATGPGGRLLKEDVQRHLDRGAEPPTKEPREKPAAQPARAPAPAVTADREEEVVPMSPLRRRIAERLVQAQQTAAMLTTFNEIDMSAVMNLRNQYKDAFEKRYGIKLGFMSFFVKASVDALKQFPEVNGEVRGTDIIYKNYYDIGIAIGSGKGLVVPILRGADRMSFAEIELAIADFARRVKDNKIKLEELQGGTFTITNGGVFGSLLSTPILNPPQSGVLGMHTIQDRPVAVNGEVRIRPMMYVALTYDHRLIDGREAVTFLRRIKESIEDPTRMLMEI